MYVIGDKGLGSHNEHQQKWKQAGERDVSIAKAGWGVCFQVEIAIISKKWWVMLPMITPSLTTHLFAMGGSCVTLYTKQDASPEVCRGFCHNWGNEVCPTDPASWMHRRRSTVFLKMRWKEQQQKNSISYNSCIQNGCTVKDWFLPLIDNLLQGLLQQRVQTELSVQVVQPIPSAPLGISRLQTT